MSQSLTPALVAAKPLAPIAHDGLAARQRSARRLRHARRQAWRRQFHDATPPDVSICIANWNCVDLLRQCLASLLDQPQGIRLEAIVVDNASTDGAPEMVQAEFPEVILVRNPDNLGFARANNQAARKSRGRYLFFLNNDTRTPPRALRDLVAYAEAHPHVGIVGPLLRGGDGKAQISYRLQPTWATLLHRTTLLRWSGLLRERYRRYRRLDFDTQTTRPVEVLMGAAMLVPREVFWRAGGWDEDYTFGGEDIDFSIRVRRTHALMYHPSVEITHYGRVSTRQHIGFASSNMAVGFLQFLRKSGCSRGRLILYKAIVTIDAPVQCLEKGVQYIWRRLRHRPEKAAKSLLAFQGSCHFLRSGLAAFWKS